MAKIGLRYPVFKSEDNQGVIAKAIQADISITSNDVQLYADDAIAESVKSFQSGTLTLGVDDLPDAIYAEFMGHNVDVGGEIAANIDDIAPYIGVGFYGVKMVNNVQKYRAIWLPKLHFSEPEDTNTTKGETVVFSTPVLVGTIMPNDDGNWKNEQTFDTIAEAETYLQGKAGIVVTP